MTARPSGTSAGPAHARGDQRDREAHADLRLEAAGGLRHEDAEHCRQRRAEELRASIARAAPSEVISIPLYIS